MDEYISKPIRVNELFAIMEQLLKAQRNCSESSGSQSQDELVERNTALDLPETRT